MYINRIELENIGPIASLDFQLSFSDNGKPNPLIIVGKNGSGKSILLSYLVNAILLLKGSQYNNTEVESGKVYKYRHPYYITSNQKYSFAKINFDDGISVYEWVLSAKNKQSFEEKYGFCPTRSEWRELGSDSGSDIKISGADSTQKKQIKSLVNDGCLLYFPANRFEEPAWLNYENLSNKLTYSELKHIEGQSNRSVICLNPLKENQNWLYDLILDRELYEKRIDQIPLTIPNTSTTQFFNVVTPIQGTSTKMYEEALKLMKTILQQKGDNLRFGIGGRQARKLSIMREKEAVVPNIFQLSTGETCLLNLFLSIMRDFDLSDAKLKTLEDISGIVVIDEVDLHLHTFHQYEILPQLIALFPKVQFIITTHSPLFLLGLEKRLGNKGFDILEFPNGSSISTESFSEFKEAYKTFAASEKFQNSVKDEIVKANKPIIYLEGNTDIQYLKRAAEIYQKESMLSEVHLKDGDGHGNLTKIWKAPKFTDEDLINKKVILLYDADTQKEDDQRGNLYKRVIPFYEDNPIDKGIENLFPHDTINKAIEHKKAFIDVREATTETIRGQEKQLPKTFTVNEDEKSNLCEWLCENGNKEDFIHFQKILEIIEGILNHSSLETDTTTKTKAANAD